MEGTPAIETLKPKRVLTEKQLAILAEARVKRQKILQERRDLKEKQREDYMKHRREAIKNVKENIILPPTEQPKQTVDSMKGEIEILKKQLANASQYNTLQNEVRKLKEQVMIHQITNDSDEEEEEVVEKKPKKAKKKVSIQEVKQEVKQVSPPTPLYKYNDSF